MQCDAIVLAPDGSDPSDRAMPFAPELARRDGGQIEAVRVREFVVGCAGGHPVNPDDEEREAKMRNQGEEVSSAGEHATMRLVTTAIHGPAHAIAGSSRRSTPTSSPSGRAAMGRWPACCSAA